MINTIYTIYDKVNEVNSGVMVGGNRAAVCQALQNAYKKPVAEGKLNPKTMEVRWIAQVDIDTLNVDLMPELVTRSTNVSDIMNMDIDMYADVLEKEGHEAAMAALFNNVAARLATKE